jgi:hypothetical protein
MEILDKIYLKKEYKDFIGAQMNELYGKLIEVNDQNK